MNNSYSLLQLKTNKTFGKLFLGMHSETFISSFKG